MLWLYFASEARFELYNEIHQPLIEHEPHRETTQNARMTLLTTKGTKGTKDEKRGERITM
jgi:hypothetical protein